MATLTPKKRKMRLEMMGTRRQLRYSQRKNSTLKNRLAMATRYRNETCLEDSLSSFNPVLSKFILSQAKLSPCQKKGRRYTRADKSLALAVYKGGPKCYRLLSKLFALPSPSTLKKELASISLKPGINEILFEYLKKSADSIKDNDKFCILMFDEMSIFPHVSFNVRNGNIEGFEDKGDVRRRKFADHALVLMIKGLTVPYKQPVFFSFSGSGTNYFDLKDILLTVLDKLFDCGFKPVATVCDQGSVNCRVVKALLEDTRISCLRDKTEYRGGYFMVNGNMIFPLFDAPHLLKCVRNNLLDKDMTFCEDGVKKLASWDNLVTAYKLVPTENFKRMYKITDSHIIPEKVKKMKVKLAAQIFSDKMSAALETLNYLRPEEFTKKPYETARILQIFDSLFDSVNGTSVHPKGGKKYRVALSNNSPHIQLWNESLKIIDTMKYVHQTTGANIKTLAPVLKNWSFSIHGILKLWNFLQGKGFKYLKCRYLNQDPLEIFFGQIRSRGVRNPSATLFTAAYKSLMICSLVSPRSPGTNCEADDSTILLSNVADFIYVQSHSSNLNSDVTSFPFVTIPDTDVQFKKICDSFSIQSFSIDAYVAGFMLKKMLKAIGSCDRCKTCCIGNPYDPMNSLILTSEYQVTERLCLNYPSKNFALNALEIRYVIEYVLNHNCENIHLVPMINETIAKYVCFDWINCEEHKNKIIKAIVKSSVPFN